MSGCSEAQFSMGFHPTASQRRGKIVLLTFERWRLATERQIGQDLTTSRVTYGASPMTGTARTVVVDLREAPGTVDLARVAILP
jgi:hypothetical protein